MAFLYRVIDKIRSICHAFRSFPFCGSWTTFSLWQLLASFVKVTSQNLARTHMTKDAPS